MVECIQHKLYSKNQKAKVIFKFMWTNYIIHNTFSFVTWNNYLFFLIFFYFNQTHLPTEIYRIMIQLYHICSFFFYCFLLLFMVSLFILLFKVKCNYSIIYTMITVLERSNVLKSSNQIRIHHYLFSKK